MGAALFADPLNPTDEEIDALEPTCFGPTWQRNDDLSWSLPERTLGWEIAEWCAKYLKAEDSGPWKFTLEQLRFILWWYAVDEFGQFIYRKGVLQRLKGWGKDPLAAVMCLVEFVGPSRVLLDHGVPVWDDNGQPVGAAHPQAWVQIAAVSRDQTRNTMTLFPSLMSDLFISTFGIKAGNEIIRAHNGRQRLEAVTSNYRSLEGGRSTFVLLNETHHWIRGNNGDKMYETIDGNTTKKNARYLAITNAYLPGEDSVAERMRVSFEGIQEGRSADVGFLYDSLEAHPSTPLTEQALNIVLPKIRGDAVWLVVKTIIQSIRDTTISPSRSRRMWLNQIVAEEDAIYGPAQLKAIENEKATLAPGDEIVMGFDGGKSDDATALVCIRVRDMTAFVLGVWERPPDWPTGEGAPRWEVNKESVDSAVHDAFRLYSVKGFYADVLLWESYISKWSEAYAETLSVKAPGSDHVSWDMRRSLKASTLAHERLMRSIFDEKLKYDGDLTLKRHTLNALRATNNYGISFRKESRESPRKVDAYAALMLAHECLYDLRARGKKVKTAPKQGWFL